MEDIDGFEPPQEGGVQPKPPHALKFFDIDPSLKEPTLSVAIAFKAIAKEIAELPEGNVRTMLFERLSDCQSSTLRAMRDFKK